MAINWQTASLATLLRFQCSGFAIILFSILQEWRRNARKRAYAGQNPSGAGEPGLAEETTGQNLVSIRRWIGQLPAETPW